MQHMSSALSDTIENILGLLHQQKDPRGTTTRDMSRQAVQAARAASERSAYNQGMHGPARIGSSGSGGCGGSGGGGGGSRGTPPTAESISKALHAVFAAAEQTAGSKVR